MAQYSKYSEVNSQWTEFVSRHPELSGQLHVTPQERRRILMALVPRRELPADVKEGSVEVRTFTIKARDGYDLPVRSYVPADATGGEPRRPLLVYLHGGGFCFGDLESGDTVCRTIATKLNMSVLNVDYRLAPKWSFPHGLNDSYDATAWAAANATTHLASSPAAGFLVGGVSSGANFAAVIAYLARDAGLVPPISGLFLSIPVCIMPQAYRLLAPELRDQLLSLEQNDNNPLLTRRSLELLQNELRVAPEDPRISFLLNTDHAGLPRRAYFQICGGDPLRDEAFLWERILWRHSGTRSMIHVYSGMPHGFFRFTQMKAAREWLDDVVEGIGFLCSPGHDAVDEALLTIKGV